ncbi:beta-ketoacyl synthase chain length factor [Paraferrimonas sedimenticola]|uniref:Beta-ketoacyl synthase-like N-terminal domain-containing protein n=1 Tax=Paraferrimonas sedimenticola TaxID=375674 RepID=A0AA37RYM3_9GAMM|nr:beta-ketoacyl synthase chain length factor [Paraferrimonas sedimenticola]GLP97027.1 hypothetical protein GCM10007895_23330 [Paraferrimonas sedimenticola]
MRINCCLQAWALKGAQVKPILSNTPAIGSDLKIPSGIKRRASQLSKLVVESGLSLLKQLDVGHLVFATRYGEIQRTQALLSALVHQEELSPTAFAQSVASTAPGLLTIATKQGIPFSTLSAGENTVESSLIESMCRFQQNPEQSVLLIAADECLPDTFSEYDSESASASLLMMYISKGDDWTVTAEFPPLDGKEPTSKNYTWIEALQQASFNQQQAQIQLSSSRWSWKPKCSAK